MGGSWLLLCCTQDLVGSIYNPPTSASNYKRTARAYPSQYQLTMAKLAQLAQTNQLTAKEAKGRQMFKTKNHKQEKQM